MTNRWLQMLEAHVEKGVLGLTVLFMAYMLWAYLIQSPYTVKYNGSELGPRELMEAVKRDADGLDARMRSASAGDVTKENFSDKLNAQHSAGIFADAAKGDSLLTPMLTRAAPFGLPIVVPGLEEAEAAETGGNIVLVPPLQTKQPKARAGRSLAVREQLRLEGLGQTETSVAPSTEPPKPVEVGWVTIAAYYDKKAQYDEMIKAGYATYRANAYVLGADVQRQEMLSNGEFSEWEDVKPGEAMPKLDLPTPQFDDQTGELINKSEIRQAYDVVKEAQTQLYQPPFFEVEAGDFWEVPSIEGYTDEAEDEQTDEEATSINRQPNERTTSGGGGRQFTPTGGSRRGPSRGPSRGGGGPRGDVGAAPSPTNDKVEARKQIRQSLKDAHIALGKKEYEEARRLGEQITGNAHATRGDIRKANDVIKVAERHLRLQAKSLGVRSTGTETQELLTHPETNIPAIWFHDDTVEAGKTYRYRMRVKLWNRYVGLVRAMKDPEQAKQSIVRGEWSLPTDPITVTPSTYFFVSGGQEPDLASMDVWKWLKGRWLKQRFDVRKGDMIGDVRKMKIGEYNEKGEEIEADVDFATGAEVLDIQFNDAIKERWPQKEGVFTYRDISTITITYLDPADGQVKQKDQFGDRNDPKHKELRDTQ